ncbi:EamA family transporter [Streptomyces sp. PKU-EA00015]|uniref:EamA family transporter n=1 Tax=Streptomyces sp. PKU-EA00015 TaxID=2748326 RepID=UPI0015A22C4B|nr:EamA family transporter [Streptomyces sp. PKU-EA00015]
MSYFGLVLSNQLRNGRLGVVLLTALAPAIWGTTYLVTTELLPPGRPLLAAVIRALPAGLLLVAVTRRLPRGIWWWRALVLGALNIGVFLALLFVAAYRLPGGVAATVGAVQPLFAAGLSAAILGDRLTRRTALAGVAGIAGVSLLVLQADARLDALGVAAALGGALVMATGVVLAKRWTSPAPLLATTGWQLVAGGLLLLPVALLVEGPPPAGLTTQNVLGYAYLSLIGAAVAYALWFRGIRALPPTAVSFLGLLSPLVATVLGLIVAGERLNGLQAVGGIVVVAALVAAQTQRQPSPRTAAASAAAPQPLPPSAGAAALGGVPTPTGQGARQQGAQPCA